MCNALLLLIMLILSESAVAFLIRMMGGGPIRGDSLPQLLELVGPTNYGCVTNSKDEIIKKIEEIALNNEKHVRNSVDRLIPGKWELMWTTEKEVLAFVRLFGKQITTITQEIDLEKGLLNNNINFAGDRYFAVQGKIFDRTSKCKKINFKFEKATLRVSPLPTISFPPVGAGYFETLYINEKFRVSKDIRGDYQISQKM